MKGRLPPFVLLSIAVLLAVWPLTLQRPGLPMGLKADEAAYYLMARSLWEDRDLRCETKDLVRVTDDFVLGADNLILLTRDGWATSYFGKPYFGSLMAAPFVAAFGARGFIAFNMLGLLLSITLGWLYLKERNGEGESLLFAFAFYIVSAAWAYVFWLQPEIASLTAVAVVLYLTMEGVSREPGSPPPSGRLRRLFLGAWTRWIWAGLAIGPAVNSKPLYLVALLPGLVRIVRIRSPRALVLFAVATAISVGGIAAGQMALTGTWSPYLGVNRRGFNVRNPYVMPTQYSPHFAPADEVDEVGKKSHAGSWWWVFRWPGFQTARVALDVRNYFVGRHAGAFVWYPFLLVSFLYFFFAGGVRSPERGALFVGMLAFFFFFLVWDFHNYHGGGGFVGNRYLVGLYPAGLYLVDRMRPLGLMLLGFLLGGLFLGQVLFAPLGAPVEEGTLQAYTRAVPFRWLPFEFNLPRQVPGYRGITQEEAYLVGRRDQVRPQGDWLRVLGNAKTEVFFRRQTGARTAAFLVRSWAPGNEVRLELGGESALLKFPPGDPPRGGVSSVAVLPLGPPDVLFKEFPDRPLEGEWYLTVHPRRSARPAWFGEDDGSLVGADVLYVGEAERLDRDVFRARFSNIVVPDPAPAGAQIEIPVTVTNSSAAVWPIDSPVRVNLSYRIVEPASGATRADGIRTPLPRAVRPGESVDLKVRVDTPHEPGDYILALEPLYEYVSWFGARDPSSVARVPLRVGTPAERGVVPRP